MILRLICCILLALVANTSNAQRIGCVHSEHSQARAITPLTADYQLIPDPVNFDPQKTYRQPVVLITFSDTDFSMANPVGYYNRLFNEKGFNQGVGVECVADYFRDQSNGQVNIQFDIYGPIKVDEKAGGHKGYYYGGLLIRNAIKQLCETEQTDFAIYDWDGDSLVNQVLFIAAGYTGNQVSGYLWPNSGYSIHKLPGGMYINYAFISCELWEDNSLCGIGTILHEYFHCLGLPDIYPTAQASAFSTVDTWDLMDGGNFTNKDWCPPNLSAMEKMYLGWSSPIELTEATSIRDIRPISDGGETYIIRSSGNSDEFYLLENRKQEGWDYGCPGNGLLIFHVDYDKDKWCNGKVNVADNHYLYDMFHADRKGYRDWNPKNQGLDFNKFTMDNWLRSRYFSTSPYPYTDSTTYAVNDSLTDNSNPASVLFTPNTEGKNFMGKAITNIKLSEDGTISFDFMNPNSSGVSILAADEKCTITGWYDLNGRRLSSPPHHSGIYIVQYNDGTKKKCYRQ